MRHRVVETLIAWVVVVTTFGCTTPQPTPDLLAPTDAQMKIRSIQTRSFDVKDRQTAMREYSKVYQNFFATLERSLFVAKQ